MTLGELVEQIEDLLDDGVPEDTEVHLGTQPKYPLVTSVNQIVHTEEDGVIITEGQNEGYGKNSWWPEKEIF